MTFSEDSWSENSQISSTCMVDLENLSKIITNSEEQAAPTLAATFAAPHLMQKIGEAVQPTLQETAQNRTLTEETGAMGKSFPEEIFDGHWPWKKSVKAVKVLLRDVQEEFLDSLPRK